MKTFFAGLAVAIAVTAIAWFGLDAAQISRVEATSGETNVRLEGHRPNQNAEPGAEQSILQR